MKSNNNLINLSIFLIFVFYASSSIILLSYSSTDGFINPDSAEYLRLSERILSGHGFFVPTSGRIEEGQETLFAVWPIGYSSLIAIVALLSGLSSFAASKVLNCFLITIAIYALFRKFNINGLIAATILLTAGTLKIYTMTWAESAFITSLIVLIVYILSIFDGKIKFNFIACLCLLILSVLPFLFRYIGIFVSAPLLIFSFYMYSLNRRSDGIKIAVIAISAFLICIIYFNINIHFTGHKTGILRAPAPESYSIWFRVLATAIAHEFILIAPNWSFDFAWLPDFAKKGNNTSYFLAASMLWFVSALFFGYLLVNKLLKHKFIIPNLSSFVFILFGLIYIFAICYARWIAHFNLFFYRTLDPGFSLIFIGVILWLLQYGKNVKKIIVLFLSISISLVAFMNIYLVHGGFSSGLTYKHTIQSLNEMYSELPDNATVLFGDDHLRYLKPNIRLVFPKIPFNSAPELFDEMLSSLSPDVNLYIENGENFNDLWRYDASFKAAVKNYPINKVSKYEIK
ncbi:hypothetical protein N9535_03255 [Amylibacter sp.]|nr:hypothetical protein [Amylibacter sp.]MDB4095673.1 hypothetical protein [Amylibacter sp.]